ncbi:MAG: cupin domain-containing protein, partial [Candidatus Melainabacteria bacterium]|nr:cupin domain-containing protein [Candidatus Melainabacteria bacterium]
MVATSLLNKELLPDECIDASLQMTTLMLGRAGGSERLYSNIDRLRPGAKSCKFHSHSLQEEFFLVIRGRGVLRLGDKTFQVCEGSCFSKPAGKGIAHQF